MRYSAGSLASHAPGVWEGALGRPQNYLPLAWCPSGQHLGVIRRAGGGGGRERITVHLRQAQRPIRRGYVETVLGWAA